MPQPALWAGVARRSGFGTGFSVLCYLDLTFRFIASGPFCPIQGNTDNAIWGRRLESCTGEERERWIPGP